MALGAHMRPYSYMYSAPHRDGVLQGLKKKGLETGGDGYSFLLNAELAAGAISSILKDSDLQRSGALPVDEALALSLQGVASVSF